MGEFFHKYVDELESTNLSLWKLSEEQELSDFYTLSTGFQRKGKGQDQNVWESAKNQNILMSMMLYPSFLPAADAFQISRWAAISIFDYLNSQGFRDVKIKWPNDIYIGKRKVAGILIQNAISGSHLSKSMIGIGLNLNQLDFVSDALNPVSLAQITDQKYQIQEELKSLVKSLQRNYHLIIDEPQKLIDKYHHLLFQLHEWAYYQTENARIEARILGVDSFGRLILEEKSGVKKHFDIKEIKWEL